MMATCVVIAGSGVVDTSSYNFCALVKVQHYEIRELIGFKIYKGNPDRKKTCMDPGPRFAQDNPANPRFARNMYICILSTMFYMFYRFVIVLYMHMHVMLYETNK